MAPQDRHPEAPSAHAPPGGRIGWRRRVIWLAAFAMVMAYLSLRFVYSSTWPRPMSRPGWREEVEKQAESLKEADAPILFFGDSITEGWRFAGVSHWERLLAPLGAINLGVWGDRTEHLLWRIERLPLEQAEPRGVVVLIGANNLLSMRPGNTARGVEAVIRRLRIRLPDTPIMLLAIFPAGHEPGPHRERIIAVNRQIARAAAESGVRYLDIGERFVDADGRIPEALMPDGLHLTTEAYGLWAEAMTPVLLDLLEAQSSASTRNGVFGIGIHFLDDQIGDTESIARNPVLAGGIGSGGVRAHPAGDQSDEMFALGQLRGRGIGVEIHHDESSPQT
jgi:lysophospholipase L1-like esterase